MLVCFLVQKRKQLLYLSMAEFSRKPVQFEIRDEKIKIIFSVKKFKIGCLEVVNALLSMKLSRIMTYMHRREREKISLLFLYVCACMRVYMHASVFACVRVLVRESVCLSVSVSECLCVFVRVCGNE